MWFVISTVVLKTDFSRSQLVTYTVNVAMSRKRCHADRVVVTIDH